MPSAGLPGFAGKPPAGVIAATRLMVGGPAASAVEKLPAHPSGVDLVGLPPPGFRWQRHLQNISQLELDLFPQQIFDPGPAGGAFLEPNHLPFRAGRA